MSKQSQKSRTESATPKPGQIKVAIQKRVRTLYVVFTLAALLIILQILLIQIGPNSRGFRNLSDYRFYKTDTVRGSWGNIYDRNGELLSTDSRGYTFRLDLHAEPLNVDSAYIKNLPALCDSLAAMLGGKPEEYKAKLDTVRQRALSGRTKSPYSQPFVTSRVFNQMEYERLCTFPLMERKYGLLVTPVKTRHKTHGNLASYTIARCVESAYKDVICAKDGVNRFVWMDARHSKSVPIVDGVNVPAEDGCDIVTTIDIQLQDVVEGALRRQIENHEAYDGTAVVVECATGEIRAMSSLTRGTKDGTIREEQNLALYWQGAPGSTFKGVSLMTLIDEAGMSINKKINCGTTGKKTINGITIKDTHVVNDKSKTERGKTTLKGIFTESSNIGFASLVTETYNDDPYRWVNYINAIGLDKVKNIQKIRGYGFNGIKSPDSYREVGGWSRTTLPQTAYGYELVMTPLQTLMFYNAVANDGKLVSPILVKQIKRDGEVVEQFSTEVINPQICKPESLAKLRECMESVVSDNLGTARSIRNMPIKVAGKTGTAQIAQTPENRGVDANGNPNAYIAKDGSRDYFSSFVGYFPADNPKYTCIVALKVNVPKGNKDKRYTGASLTLDAFREIAEYIYSHDPEWKSYAVCNVAPTPTTKSQKGIYDHREGTVPKVVGMGLRDALYELESLGLKVKFSGSGVVVDQSLESYSPFTPGDEITLRLENKK